MPALFADERTRYPHVLSSSFPSSMGKVTACWASIEKSSVLLSSTRRELYQFEGIRVYVPFVVYQILPFPLLHSLKNLSDTHPK